jgi:hypothetical protein
LLCNKDEGLGSLPATLLTLLLKEESNVPKVAGPSAAEVVKKVFSQLQAGRVDRSKFGTEFNIYLSAEKVSGASKRLKGYGAPRDAKVLQSRERGGLEVTTTRLGFGGKSLQVLMYRQPDGTIEQFFVDEP